MSAQKEQMRRMFQRPPIPVVSGMGAPSMMGAPMGMGHRRTSSSGRGEMSSSEVAIFGAAASDSHEASNVMFGGMGSTSDPYSGVAVPPPTAVRGESFPERPRILGSNSDRLMLSGDDHYEHGEASVSTPAPTGQQSPAVSSSGMSSAILANTARTAGGLPFRVLVGPSMPVESPSLSAIVRQDPSPPLLSGAMPAALPGLMSACTLPPSPPGAAAAGTGALSVRGPSPSFSSSRAGSGTWREIPRTSKYTPRPPCVSCVVSCTFCALHLTPALCLSS